MQFLNYLGLEHYHSLLLGLFVKQETLKNYYTKAEADILHTSMVRIKGDVTYIDSGSERKFTMQPSQIGDSYVCKEAGSYIDDRLHSHVLEVGDIVVSLGDLSGSGAHEYTVIQSNWTATKGTSSLNWGQSTKLANIGGIDITATLPANPATGKADISDLDAYLPLDGSKAMVGDLNLGEKGILFNGTQRTYISQTNEGLDITIGGTKILDLTTLPVFNTSVQATSFIKTGATADDILLGDGTTTPLSSLQLTGDYLPLTGGTLTGDVIFNNCGLQFNETKTAAINLTESGELEIKNSNGIILTGDVTCSSDVNATAFYETSDARKKDIKSDLSLDKCYDLVDKCQTVIYSLKDQTKEQVGMIAQEIEEFFPEVVATDEEGFKSLAYDRLVVICFKVLKDVIKRLEKLENV